MAPASGEAVSLFLLQLIVMQIDSLRKPGPVGQMLCRHSHVEAFWNLQINRKWLVNHCLGQSMNPSQELHVRPVASIHLWYSLWLCHLLENGLFKMPLVNRYLESPCPWSESAGAFTDAATVSQDWPTMTSLPCSTSAKYLPR